MRIGFQGFGSSAQKFNHSLFVIAACYADWTPWVCANTARKRQICPNDLLASTARTSSTTCVFAVVCSFRRSVVIGALPAPSLHQNELRALTACTFSKHWILMFVVKAQPSVVSGAPLSISSLRRSQASCERPWLAKVAPASPF